MAEREKRTEITQDRVLKEYARIGFFDPRKLFDETGIPLPIGQIDDDTAAVISGIDVATIGNAEHGIGEVLKLRLSNKIGALDSMAKHLGMFNASVKVDVTNSDCSMTRQMIDASALSQQTLTELLHARSKTDQPDV
jgi:phage terminase small subunit